MTRTVLDFASRFGAEIALDESLIVRKDNRYFVLNENLKRLARGDFFYAGLYLGKLKGNLFFPSFNLLSMIAQKKCNKIKVDLKTEWLFICGRDIFAEGIVKVAGQKRKGSYTLVLNGHEECLGFGRFTQNFDEGKCGVVVKNISDVGDYLRRERNRS